MNLTEIASFVEAFIGAECLAKQLERTPDVEAYNKHFDDICKAIAETITGEKIETVKPAASKSENVKIQTGGLSPNMRKEMEDWLKEKGWYYKIIE